MWIALFAWRSPPRESRWRMVRPEEDGCERMTAKERRAAAETLGRVVAQIDGGEVDAPA